MWGDLTQRKILLVGSSFGNRSSARARNFLRSTVKLTHAVIGRLHSAECGVRACCCWRVSADRDQCRSLNELRVMPARVCGGKRWACARARSELYIYLVVLCTHALTHTHRRHASERVALVQVAPITFISVPTAHVCVFIYLNMRRGAFEKITILWLHHEVGGNTKFYYCFKFVCSNQLLKQR